MQICIIGDGQDLSAVYVAWLARERGFEVIELSEDALGLDWGFGFDDLQIHQGHIIANGSRYSLNDLACAFVRLNPRPSLPSGLELPPEDRSLFLLERAIWH